MQAVLIILTALVLLILGYIGYGGWLAKKWGIDPKRKTPAITKADGVDYVEAKPVVLMGHHFSSIAGAGPINGPIQAAVFGWVPVFLWCVVGGIFVGGAHDFGSLFASVRHDGKSIGEVIADTMGQRAKKLFIGFALLVLILVIASFVNVVADTFKDGEALWGLTGITPNPSGNATTAMISMIFIVLAIFYGLMTNRGGLKTLPATLIGIALIVAGIWFSMNFGLSIGRNLWIVLIGGYIFIASLVPVWILLQPRDYLSSFLLYAMILLAFFGIIFAAAAGTATFKLPAFTGWNTSLGALFPTLFITVACGACSGFHSLIASGTTAKQLNSEASAKPIAYGSMLIESALGVISLIAIGVLSASGSYADAGFATPASAFAGGIASMFGASTSSIYAVVYALLTLAVSVFALTSLDTGTRLSRYMFSELFLKEGEATWKDAKGFRRFLAHPLVGTLFMVTVGCILGGLSLSQIWGLFGAANQLLAGVALMAVAAWLGHAGKSRRMLIIPMIFMLAATLTSLVITIINKLAGFADGSGLAWGNWFQFFLALGMVVLSVILVIEGIQTFKRQEKSMKGEVQ